MELVLTVTQAPPGADILNQQAVFGAGGGVIGRGQTNACQLPCPDRVVSSQHALIALQNGQFTLTDTSKNGTEVNGTPAPGQNATPLVLKNGDLIQCGRFVMEVAIKSGTVALPRGLDSVDFLDAPAALPAIPSLNPPANSGLSATPNDFDSNAASGALGSDDLDSWLDTPDHSSSPSNSSTTDGWGSVAENNNSNADPMAALNHASPESGISSTNDPWDDDWWKGESTSDHAPAASHHIDLQPKAFNDHAVDIPVPTPKPGSSAVPRPGSPGNLPPANVQTAGQRNPQPNTAGADSGWGAVDSQPGSPGELASATPSFQTPTGVKASNIDDVLGFDPTPAAEGSPPPAEPWGQAQSTRGTPPDSSRAPQAAAAKAPRDHSSAPQAGGQRLSEILGLNPKVALPEETIAPMAAAIIKRTIGRLMDLMRVRANIKNELRVQHTTLQAQDNNPLKFSVNAEDALGILFSEGRNASFLSPEEAIEDSFEDLSDHQLATMAGMQAAYDFMLKQFSPTRLENDFNNKAGLLSNKGSKNWDGYKHHYDKLLADKEGTYNQLFGRAFTKQYELRLAELKNQRLLRDS